jgi:hypothetical protein
MIDDAGSGLFAGQQEGGDGWRDGPGNGRDLFVADDTGAAGHLSYQSQGIGSLCDGQTGLVLRGDTTYFYSCTHWQDIQGSNIKFFNLFRVFF